MQYLVLSDWFQIKKECPEDVWQSKLSGQLHKIRDFAQY